jgi:hypothetical protein
MPPRKDNGLNQGNRKEQHKHDDEMFRNARRQDIGKDDHVGGSFVLPPTLAVPRCAAAWGVTAGRASAFADCCFNLPQWQKDRVQKSFRRRAHCVHGRQDRVAASHLFRKIGPRIMCRFHSVFVV